MPTYRRKPLSKITYNSGDTRRYKSAWQRWRRGQAIEPLDTFSVGSNVLLTFASDRAPSGYWTVTATRSGGGAPFSDWLVLDPADIYPPAATPPNASVLWFRYYRFQGGGLISLTAVPYVEGGEPPGEGTGEEIPDPNDPFIARYSMPFQDGSVPPEPAGLRDTPEPYWGEYEGNWAFFRPGGAGGILNLGYGDETWLGGYPPGYQPPGGGAGGGGAGGSGALDVVSCDCPDKTKQVGANPRSLFGTERRDRNWSSSRAGSAGLCKHQFSARVALALETSEPKPDDPKEYRRWLGERARIRRQKRKRQRFSMAPEVAALIAGGNPQISLTEGKARRLADRAEIRAIRKQLKGLRMARSAKIKERVAAARARRAAYDKRIQKRERLRREAEIYKNESSGGDASY